MTLGEIFTLGGAVGSGVFVPTALVSDVTVATIGGIITAFITTGGAVLIALINRSQRQAPGPGGDSSPRPRRRLRQREEEIPDDDA